MTQADNPPPADVPVPPPFDGLPERCAAIPWDVRGKQVFRGFWKTVGLSLFHPGKLGELIDQPVDPRQAREFRQVVVLHFVLPLMVNGIVRGIMFFRQQNGGPLFIFLFTTPVMLLLSWLLIRLMIGTSRWFFCPPHLSPRRQETSLALSYYLTGPLAISSFAWLALPLLAVDSVEVNLVAILLSSLPPLAAMAWYYVVVVIGLRNVAQRSGANLVLSAAGVAACWIVIWASFVLVPAFLAMWVLMYGSFC